jgi:murein DD-endopeptidase MepM/ murein hydrolase activator NlpD
MTVLSSLVAVVLAVAVHAPGAAHVRAPSPFPSVPSPAQDSAVWPLQPADGRSPEVAARFDPPEDAYAAGHRGVDLVGAEGESVHSSLAGTVSFAGTVAGRGVVVVDHGSTRTTYEPVLAQVRVGDTVTTGAVIGVLGGGGSHCPPRVCLHWGLRAGEDYLDPLTLVNAGPVRLLPLAPPL